MSENEKNVPKRRFKEFENAESWEQFKLEDLCSIVTKQTGFDYSATIKPSLQVEMSDTTYPFIQNKDFSGMNINLDTDFFIPKNIAEKFPKILLDKPSILISISGKIGNVGFYRLDNKAFIGGAVGICKLLDASDGVLIVYELLSDIGQLHFSSLTKASSHANITVEDIRKLPIKIPKSVKEKELIGMFFSSTDNLITLQQRKLDKMKALKKAYLTDMFPAEGERKPKMRFAGFTDDWEQRKLKDVSTYSNGGSFENHVQEKGKYELITLKSVDMDGNLIHSGRYIDIEVPTLTKGTLVMILSEQSPGLLGMTAQIPIDNTYILNQRVAEIRPNQSVDSYFLSMAINKNQQYFSRCGAGTKVQNISKSNVENYEFLCPLLQEQQKIGQFFTNFDKLITLHQRKLEKLQNIKKAYLNEMFI